MTLPAIAGGKPVRDIPIGYGRQCIEADDIEAVVSTLKSDFITCGPQVAAMEKALCDYTGAKYAIAVSNGTTALHTAAIAAGIGPGDEVITTPITFVASANCVLYCGAKVVFADINPRTYNIDPEEIERKVTAKTKAVVAVDFTGQVVEARRIRDICDKYNLFFIEDAAHSIGSKYNGNSVGSIADLTTFSFHPVKTITGGEGGAVLTNSETLYKKALLAHAHGITKNFEWMLDGHSNEPWYYEMQMLGSNYRLTDFQAALITSQLGKIERFKNRRKKIVDRYNEVFADMPEIIVQEEIPESDSCKHLYILRLNLDMLKCDRAEFFAAMAAEKVHCQVHYIPVYWFPYYKDLGYNRGLCPIAEDIYNSIISLPLFPLMTDGDVESVIKAVKKIVSFYRR